MNTRLFADLFTILMLAALAGRGAYCFGFWLGWVMDPEQWPRFTIRLLIDIFRWDREVSKFAKSVEEWQATFDWNIAEGGRTPRETVKGGAK